MKYRILIILLIATLSFSCGENESLALDFEKEIIKYQKAFPLPIQNDTLYPLYAIKFRKIENDTVFHIVRSYVHSDDQFNQYEIFENKNLKPTVIFDFENLGKKLIKEYPKSKGRKLLKSAPIENLNPYYLYKLENNKINFLKKENYKQ